MTIRILVLVSSLCFLGCQQKPQAQPSKIQGITLLLNWDLEKGKSFADNYTDDVDIIYQDSLVMLRDWIRNVELGERSTTNTGDTVRIRQQIKLDSSRNNTIDRYFVYKEGNSKGRMYSSLDESEFRTFYVDSLLAAKALKGGVFYNDNDSLVYTEKSVGGFDLLQKYVPKSKPDASYPDTSYMFFSEGFKNIRYSFSPELDSKMKMKLVKVLFAYNPGKDEKGNKTDGRKMEFEIKRVVLPDPQKIIALFERYKNESGIK